MEIVEKLLLLEPIPLSYHLVKSFLIDYKRPNDKINELVKKEQLISLKRGHYAIGPKLRQMQPNPFSVSNILYGPSYISFETALSWHGLIPEKVVNYTSATTKPSHIFTNGLGTFEYIHLRTPYYSFGLNQIKLNENIFALMASREKALFDTVVNTTGLQITSIVGCEAYLIENLRIEIESLKTLNIEMMRNWLTHAPKKSSLEILIKTIERL